MGLYSRIVVIFLSIMIGYLIYVLIVKPLVLDKLCLTNAQNCVKIAYYPYEDSVLVFMENSNYWIWYNGDEIYLYGSPLGEMCMPNWSSQGITGCTDKCPGGAKCINGICPCDDANPPFQPAYKINPQSGVIAPRGYVCVKDLRCVQYFYNSKNVDKRYLVVRAKNPQTFGAVDVVNELIRKKIISINK